MAASPFFAVFASMRLMLLVLCGETVMIVAIVFNDGGLAFPGWICFALSMLVVITGFPTWWEPKSNNNARLHIICAALSCFVTILITTLLSGKFETATSRQGAKVVGLYAGLAALQFLDCIFAIRVMNETDKVDLYVKARLIEWR